MLLPFSLTGDNCNYTGATPCHKAPLLRDPVTRKSDIRYQSNQVRIKLIDLMDSIVGKDMMLIAIVLHIIYLMRGYNVVKSGLLLTTVQITNICNILDFSCFLRTLNFNLSSSLYAVQYSYFMQIY